MTDISTQSIETESSVLKIPVVSLDDDESLSVFDDESTQVQSILSDDDTEQVNLWMYIVIIIVSVEESYSKYYTSEKNTAPILTKFERAKLLGIRAEMISAGNSPLVVVPRGVDNAYEIALLELKEKKIPLIIRRHLPNGTVEDWRIEELIIKDM